MLLHLMTWREVETCLKASTGIMMPIGSTEQHGPTGLIGTDAICAKPSPRRRERSPGAVVGPTIGVGMAQHHMAFTGSMTLRPSTLVSVISDYVDFARAARLRALLFHQRPRRERLDGADGLPGGLRPDQHRRRRRPASRALCAPQLVPAAPRASARQELLRRQGGGITATPSEIAVTQYVRPDAIKVAELPPPPPPAGGFSFTDAEDYRHRFPDGRMASDPSLATPEHGRELLELAAEDLAADYRDFLRD